jgi:hypothetical protein
MGGHAALQVYDLLAASALSVGPATARPHVSLMHLWGFSREKYYNSSTRRHVALWHGKWEIKGNTLCNDWKDRPNNPLPKPYPIGPQGDIAEVTHGKVI